MNNGPRRKGGRTTHCHHGRSMLSLLPVFLCHRIYRTTFNSSYITLWSSVLYICFHGLHESHANKFISSSSPSSSPSPSSSTINYGRHELMLSLLYPKANTAHAANSIIVNTILEIYIIVILIIINSII